MKAKYDVAVVGGGIAGLVAAAYVAKQGLKVVVIERSKSIGGYGTSFIKNECTFDIGVHYFGGLREGGQLRLIFDELELFKYVNLTRLDPCDFVIFDGFEQPVWNDNKRNIFELQKRFPLESKKLEDFFTFVLESPLPVLFYKLKDLYFSELLDKFFKDPIIKEFFRVFLLNIGLPSFRVAALSVIILLREYILDGGYYPLGGIQILPSSLEKIILLHGGKILTDSSVTKLVVESNTAKFLTVNGEGSIEATHYIIACDAHSFLNSVLEADGINEYKARSNNFIPSMSACVHYLVLDKLISKSLKHSCSSWFSLELQSDSNYEEIYQGNPNFNNPVMLFCFPSAHDESLCPPGKSIMNIFVGAPYVSEDFWRKEKESYSKFILSKAKKYVNFSDSEILFDEFATPLTFNRYTNNFKGSLYGWSSTPSQILKSNFPCNMDNIENIYIAGHWNTAGFIQGGIPMVALSGRLAANQILKKYKHAKFN